MYINYLATNLPSNFCQLLRNTFPMLSIILEGVLLLCYVPISPKSVSAKKSTAFLKE